MNLVTKQATYYCELMGSKFEMYVDYMQGRIHLFDLDESGTRSVTNNIDSLDFRRQIMSTIDQFQTEEPVEIYWVGTDHLACKFGLREQHKHIPKEEYVRMVPQDFIKYFYYYYD